MLTLLVMPRYSKVTPDITKQIEKMMKVALKRIVSEFLLISLLS
jgi:hypothetical protein